MFQRLLGVLAGDGERWVCRGGADGAPARAVSSTKAALKGVIKPWRRRRWWWQVLSWTHQRSGGGPSTEANGGPPAVPETSASRGKPKTSQHSGADPAAHLKTLPPLTHPNVEARPDSVGGES